jgi:hypothetical protein
MYELHSLGWSSFQQLCLTITREILGQTVESFLDSNDGGRDGAFAGIWKRSGQEDLSGPFVVQCKFTSKRDSRLRPSDLSGELRKAGRLVRKGLCDSYLLMTNADVSGKSAETVSGSLTDAGVKHVRILGSTWISQQIRENQRLRMLVPRVYGLGDLSQILDERAYSQARTILESLREDLAKVVVTESYRRAARALDLHGFVLLVGEPAAGKTTIASLLAMAALDQWNALLLKVDDPGTVVERWNPNELSQFFWVDDAFGVTQYEDSLVRRWNHALPQVGTMLRRGAKIVMTSRDYIYNRARSNLKESAFPLLRESQVVIDVHELTIAERCQILYNHLKLGRQPRSFRSEIKPHLDEVARHERFIPEAARQLADPFFTRQLTVDPYYLRQFIEKREQLLQDVLMGLDADSKAALALIYMRNGHLESPIELSSLEVDAIARLGSGLGGCHAALEALKGSLVLFSNEGGDAYWRFKHPTVGDAYAELLVKSPELMVIYVRGTAPERLVERVTCGDVGIENAIVVPRSLFPLMIEKLGEIANSSRYKTAGLAWWDVRRIVQGFLTVRCSRDFLSLYLENDPSLLEKVAEPGLFLDSVPEVRLAVRLHEFGLLPDEQRRRFVKTVSRYAIEGDDPFALDDDGVRKLLSDDEFEGLLQTVRAELLPRLGAVRCEWESNYTSGEPDQYMQQLLDGFEILRRQFGSESEANEILDRESELVNDWIVEHAPEEPDRSPRRMGAVDTIHSTKSTRSIFDDIDE